MKPVIEHLMMIGLLALQALALQKKLRLPLPRSKQTAALRQPRRQRSIRAIPRGC